MQFKRVLLCVSMAMLLCSGSLHGQDASTILSRADIEKIVREYIIQHPEVLMFRPGWKWRGRSAAKIAERTREEDTKALHGRRESRDSEATFAGAGAGFQAL
jgi:hypothetical protein